MLGSADLEHVVVNCPLAEIDNLIKASRDLCDDAGGRSHVGAETAMTEQRGDCVNLYAVEIANIEIVRIGTHGETVVTRLNVGDLLAECGHLGGIGDALVFEELPELARPTSVHLVISLLDAAALSVKRDD